MGKTESPSCPALMLVGSKHISMDSSIWAHFSGKNTLLLQGPAGPFFSRISTVLKEAGCAEVRKINFNAGDWVFYQNADANYKGTLEEWPAYLLRFIQKYKIDVVIIFGDCRPIHIAAKTICESSAVELWVFEEGYVRPDFITFERDGVNAHSCLPRDTDFYYGLEPAGARDTFPIGKAFWRAALYSAIYYFIGALGNKFFPNRLYHRDLRFLLEGLLWTRGAMRKIIFKIKERGELEILTAPNSPFFLIALQVNHDFQVQKHSGFASVEAFIRSSVASFASSADSKFTLVIKHHPLDRPYHDYSSIVCSLRADHNLGDRLRYLHDQHLPTLLSNAVGVIVINSTVGMSALQHGVAVKPCGLALYDLPGLCYQGGLDEFWAAAPTAKPNLTLLDRYLGFVIEKTQINGNFYKFDRRSITCSNPRNSPSRRRLLWKQMPNADQTLSKLVAGATLPQAGCEER